MKFHINGDAHQHVRQCSENREKCLFISVSFKAELRFKRRLARVFKVLDAAPERARCEVALLLAEDSIKVPAKETSFMTDEAFVRRYLLKVEEARLSSKLRPIVRRYKNNP